MAAYKKAIKNLEYQEGDDFTVDIYFPKELSVLNQNMTFAVFRKGCPRSTDTTLKRVDGVTTTSASEFITKSVIEGSVTITEVTVTVDGIPTLYDKAVVTFIPTDTRGYAGTHDYEVELDTTQDGEITVLGGDFTITKELIQ